MVDQYPFDAMNKDGPWGYPTDLDDDPKVFFHGTAEKNLRSILDYGFRIAGPLPSVSFAKVSSLALKYACEARNEESPRGCVIVVSIDPKTPGIVSEPFGVHVYKLDPQPTILSYCIVPKDYRFV